MLWALDGSAPPVLGVDPVSCAWARALAKVDDEPVPVDAVPVALGAALWLVAAATDGSNAVWREAICAWICETRVTASV